MNTYRDLMEIIGTAIDFAGVMVIVLGAVYATYRFVKRRDSTPTQSYGIYRRNLGRAILLGLEFLIAGDIIRTVGVSPNLQNLAVLGLIVLIRTFLSITLELELEGHWPWQASARSNDTASE